MSSPSLLSSLLTTVHNFLSSFLIFLLTLGPIPRHVGFVMDGNRRYARERGRRVVEGHGEGFESLKRTLEICLKLNIRAVTIYAFAIDNFSRPQEEVDAIMLLARKSLLELCREGEFLHRNGIRMSFIGQLHLLPVEVQDAIKEMEALTAGHKTGVLNVCCPYASRDEITTAVRDTVRDVYDGRVLQSQVTPDTIFSNLPISRSVASLGGEFSKSQGGNLDILVRTSNVKRLSDFMMWQASRDTQLHFVKTYWPEFGLTDMLPILLGWQQKIWLKNLGL